MILTCGLSYCLCWIIQKSKKCLFEWSKQPKMRFLAIFLSFVHLIDLKWHIFILLNDVDSWDVISLVLDHSKITKMLFWMIQRAKNEVFDHFMEDYWWDSHQIAHEYSLEECLRPCTSCWVNKDLEVRYFAYWLSQCA